MKNKNLKLKFKYIVEKIINYNFHMLYGCEDDGNDIIFDKIYFGERIVLSYDWDHEYELCDIIFEFKKIHITYLMMIYIIFLILTYLNFMNIQNHILIQILNYVNILLNYMNFLN